MSTLPGAPNLSIPDLIEAGRYRDAAKALSSLSVKTVADKVAEQIVELQVGDPKLVRARTVELLAQRLPIAERVQCLIVAGKAAPWVGRVNEGCNELREALSIAKSKRLAVLAARAQAQLVNVLLGWVSIESALSELGSLRNYAYSAADSRSLVEFHCCVAEIEMKGGRHGSAAGHLKVAESLCEREPNLLKSAHVARLKANLAFLSGAPRDALKHIRRAAELVSESGSCLGLIPTLSSLSHASWMLGALDEAQAASEQMLNLRTTAAPRIAALDTLLLIALERHDRDTARKLVSRIDVEPRNDGGAEYMWLWHVPTRAKWLCMEDRATDAVALLDKNRPAAADTQDSHLLTLFGFAEAETLIRAGNVTAAATGLSKTVSKLPTVTLQNLLTMERLSSELLPETVLSRTLCQLRANRTTTLALTEQPGIVTSTHQASCSTWSPFDALNAVAALFAVPFQCELIAHEIVSLLVGTGCVLRADITRHSESVVRPAASNAMSIDLGVQEGVRYEVVAYPHDDAMSRLTLLAVQRLAKAAVAIKASHDTKLNEDSQNDTRLWPQDGTDQQTGMVIAAESMNSLSSITRRVAASNATVLFTGETGTGKELLARALHDSSPRSDKPFIPFNCTAVARDMLDSQLFGYRRGAFTGAHDAFPGVIRAAAGGTLFLDEVGDISLDVQPKLLRFLESGEIHPLGEPRPMTIDVRVVAATNANLEQLVAEGRFREDLFYRLNVVRLQVPPLRERREEIPLLVQYFLDKCSRESKKTGIRVAEETMEYLVLFRWPGNVRQLANELRRMVALAEPGAVLMPEHLSPDIAASRRTLPPSQRPLAPTEFVVRMDQPMTAAVEHLERSMIHYAMQSSDGRQEDAAQKLGLSRKGLYLKRLRLNMADASLREEEIPEADDADSKKAI